MTITCVYSIRGCCSKLAKLFKRNFWRQTGNGLQWGGMTAVCSVACSDYPGRCSAAVSLWNCQWKFAVGVKTREISLKKILVGTLSKYCDNFREVSLTPLPANAVSPPQPMGADDSRSILLFLLQQLSNKTFWFFLDFGSENSLKSIVTIIVMGTYQWLTSFCL